MPFLDWINKNQAKQQSRDVPYHLLNHQQSFGDSETTQNNILIKGDNLLALKALIPMYAGKIKCIFIDPPYNTMSAFEHYDDKLEHSQWLSMIYPRLVILRDLLASDGSIWITIDDNEAHYLKVICDEIFGRSNFIGQVTWQKTTSIHNNAVLFSSNTDLILSYAKNIEKFKMGRIPRSERNKSDYTNQDNDQRGPWASSPLHVSLTSGQRGRQYALTGKSSGLYPIIGPNGQEVYPPKGRCWAYSAETIKEFESQNLIWWGINGDNQPRLKRFIKDNKEGVVPSTLWLAEDVGHNQEAKSENSNLLPHLDKLFSTPKPERLLERIIGLSTAPNDVVLDSFAGSGTTGAVAHKMGRRWIMVELGDHCESHLIPRIRKVIEGDDQFGVSKSVNWHGGGGFSFYTLGEPAFDEYGQINLHIRFPTLAAYVWTLETGSAAAHEFTTAKLGYDDKGSDIFLLYNGILGDKKPQGGNVLTASVLNTLRELQTEQRPMIIYGESCRIGPARLAAEQITFKQIPYDIKIR